MINNSNQYFNNELSLLEFNARVLEEGLSDKNPLLERLKFLSIISSNFDEFFMVRVAAIKSKRARRMSNSNIDSSETVSSDDDLLSLISERVREITKKQYDCLNNVIFPELATHGLTILRPSEYDAETRRWLDNYFNSQVAPVLTPLAFDVVEDNKLPPTGNLRIHAAFILHARNELFEQIAVIQVPPNMGRFIRLPTGPGIRLALLDELILEYGHRLFPGYSVRERTLFKVTRDADIDVDEDRADDFVAAMEEAIINRQSATPVRLSITALSDELEKKLKNLLDLTDMDVYKINGPIDLKGFMDLSEIKGFGKLRYKIQHPVYSLNISENNTILDEISKQDIVLHMPYESFNPIIAFVETAAKDPNVLAIKTTLYRTSGESPVVKALIQAARAGKQVTAVVELKARFDEERNMAWAATLEQAGAIVVYGASKLKVHAKAMLIVRREPDGFIRRYVNLSTGNFNDTTALVYGDISIFTVNDAICSETSAFFNTITGLSALPELETMSMAPFGLKRRIISMIEREAERSSPESPGLIIAKMNALSDKNIIDALYKAAQAGVKIMLNVRGICQLIPGIQGISDNIRVVSIVGRYLEHARICYFKNGGAGELYLSSADWMPRNFEKRVELLFPVLGEAAIKRVLDILLAYFDDNAGAWVLDSSGCWEKYKNDEPLFSAQNHFYESSSKMQETGSVNQADRVLQIRRNNSSA